MSLIPEKAIAPPNPPLKSVNPWQKSTPKEDVVGKIVGVLILRVTVCRGTAFQKFLFNRDVTVAVPLLQPTLFLQVRDLTPG